MPQSLRPAESVLIQINREPLYVAARLCGQFIEHDRTMPLKDHEKRKAYQRAWAAAKRAKNPEPARIASRKYRAKNLEIVRQKDRGRRRAASKAKDEI
jgi:hypothetical protein